MGSVRVTLSIRADVLADIDRKAREAGMTRSAFLAWRGIRNACAVSGLPTIDQPSWMATERMSRWLAGAAA